MNLTDEQKRQLNNIFEHRDQIVELVFRLEKIIKQYFPEEFDIAYQHWIPQIITAMYEDNRWLPRGEQTLQHTINRILDKEKEKSQEIGQGIRKFI